MVLWWDQNTHPHPPSHRTTDEDRVRAVKTQPPASLDTQDTTDLRSWIILTFCRAWWSTNLPVGMPLLLSSFWAKIKFWSNAALLFFNTTGSSPAGPCPSPGAEWYTLLLVGLKFKPFCTSQVQNYTRGEIKCKHNTTWHCDTWNLTWRVNIVIFIAFFVHFFPSGLLTTENRGMENGRVGKMDTIQLIMYY